MSGQEGKPDFDRFRRRALNRVEAVAAINEAAATRLVVFAGAGVSVSAPASCPTWFSLVRAIVGAAAEAHPRLRPVAEAATRRWLDSSLPVKVEQVCQFLHANLGSLMLDAFNILVRGAPNGDHRAIAELSRRQKVPLIITTNFDPYIEEALDAAGVPFELHVGDPPRKVRREVEGRGAAKITHVVKPHGSIADAYSMVVTMRQSGRPAAKALHQLITTALTNATVLLVGYSGNDDDIFPALLGAAPAARRVFWALWDEQSLTPNLAAFVQRCASCSLVLCEGKSLLQEFAPPPRAPLSAPDLRAADALQANGLRLWASAVPRSAWENFFCELLLTFTPSPEEAALIVRAAENVIDSSRDQLAVLRARRNKALALLVENRTAEGVELLKSASADYMRAGRQREVIELAALISENAPVPQDANGSDPISAARTLTSTPYEPYTLGLMSYAEGVQLALAGKYEVARKYLLSAAGFALWAGDMTTVKKCFNRLAIVAEEFHDPQLGAQYRRQGETLERTLSVVDADEPTGRSAVLDECEAAAERLLRKYLLFEVLLGCFFAAVMFIVAILTTAGVSSALFLTGCGMAAYAFGKVRATRRIQAYAAIDRT
jgi:hypothetical protein